MEKYAVKPVPQKLAPGRSLAQLGQMMIDLAEMPGNQFDKVYPDFEPAWKRAEWEGEGVPHETILLRLMQHAFKDALGEGKPDPARIVMAPDDIFMRTRDYIRSLAVMCVDGKYGFTMEFNSNPKLHQEQYDLAESNIIAAIEAAMQGRHLAAELEIEIEDNPYR